MTYRPFVIALALIALIANSPQRVSAAATAATAPIEALFAAFNTGDGAKLYACYASDAQIVDEFAPFHWSAPGAARAFWAEFTAANKSEKLTDVHVSHAPFAFLTYDDAKKTAYVVATTTFHYTLDGKPGMETGRWTFVLEKTATGWLIERSTWGRLT